MNTLSFKGLFIATILFLACFTTWAQKSFNISENVWIEKANQDLKKVITEQPIYAIGRENVTDNTHREECLDEVTNEPATSEEIKFRIVKEKSIKTHPAQTTLHSNHSNQASIHYKNTQQATYGWVLTERKPVRGTTPTPAEGGEVRVDFGQDAIEMLLAKPFGNGAGGSRDLKNPQRLQARYSWSVPDVIQPSGQLVIVVKQEVLSNTTGKWANGFGVGIMIQNNWSLKGKLTDGTVVEPWVFGIGWGKPDWAQKNTAVTYERTWLWNQGNTGEKRMVSVSVQGIGTQKIEYMYEWKPVTSNEAKTKTAQLPTKQTTPESVKPSETKSAANDSKNSLVKLNVDLNNTDAIAGDLTKNAIQFIVSKETFDQKVKLQVTENKNASQFDKKRATHIGTPVDITIDQESKRLNQPLTVKLKLDKNEIAALKRPIDLWIGYFNGKNWDYFPPLEVNLKDGFVKFETYHLSPYTKAELAKTEQINNFSYKNAVNKWAEKDNNLLTRQATQQMVNQILSKNMGITNKSISQDVVEAIMKEHDYAKLLVSYNDNKMDEFGTDLAVLAGKKIFEVVKNQSNAKALLGTVTNHSSKIGAGVNIGIAISQGNLEKAAKELSLEIINTYPITKLFKTAADITERQINRWRDQELEAAYQVYVKGANSNIPFWGYQVEAGNFNQVWSQMRGLENKIQSDALKNYAAANNKTVSQLDNATIEMVRKQTKENLQLEFSKRKEQESKIEALKAENLKLIKEFENANLLTERAFGYTDNTSFDLRLIRLFIVKDMILKDTKSRIGFTGVNEAGIISAKTVAGLIQLWYSENGKELYRKELIRLGYLKETDQAATNGKEQIQQNSSTENWKIDSSKPETYIATSKRKILEKTAQCSECYLDINVTAKVNSASSSSVSGEIDKKLRSWMSESGWYPVEASIESITINGFKGRLLTTTLKYNDGFGSPMAGYKYGKAHIGGYAILTSDDGLRSLKVSYYAFASSCWDNKSAETSKKEAMSGKNEAEKLVRSLNVSGTKINASVGTGKN